jgi:hypothetical protein
MSQHLRSLDPVLISAKSAGPQLWRSAYEAACWELDEEKLLPLIHATEAALFIRWQELEDIPAHYEERDQMASAAKDLLAIKIQRLDWPNPCW